MARRVRDGILIMAMMVFLTTLVGSILKRPLFSAAITSDSMLPLLHRGDLVIAVPTLFHQPGVGDIAIFSPGTGPWVAHRIVAGNSQEGFHTKGDANKDTDQRISGFPIIRHSDIVAVVVTVQDRPLKIPMVGNLSLAAHPYIQHPLALPAVGLLVAFLLVRVPQRQVGRSHAKGSGSYMPFVVLLIGGGLAWVMAAKSVHLTQNYEVVASNQQLYVGTGGRGVALHTQQVSSVIVGNDSRLPLLFVIAGNTPDFSASEDWVLLWPGERKEVTLTFGAETLGPHKGDVRIGTFFPVLPPELLHRLAAFNFWVAVATASTVGVSPLLVLWLWNARQDRSRIVRHRPRARAPMFGLVAGRSGRGDA